MKILLISDLYPINNGNEPKTLLYFVEEWLKSGHTVDIIRPNFLLNTIIRRKKVYKPQILEAENSKIFNLNYVTPFLFNIKNKLPKDFSVNNYDIVISHMPSGTLFAAKLLANSDKPFICSVHASDIQVLIASPYKLYFSKQLKKAYKRANLIGARSFVLKEKIESIIPEAKGKIFVAYSGIDENFIEEKLFFIQKMQKLCNTKQLKIATTASLIKRKNVDVILRALSKLEGYNWEWTIIGEGNQLNNLKNLAKNLKIDDKVKFTGKLNQENVFEVLRQSNLFILLSQNETFGMAYLEAMAKGNIVIATKNDGIDGIIKDGINGFTSNINEDNLLEKIQLIMNLSYINLEEISLNIYNSIWHYTKKNAAQNYLKFISGEKLQ